MSELEKQIPNREEQRKQSEEEHCPGRTQGTPQTDSDLYVNKQNDITQITEEMLRNWSENEELKRKNDSLANENTRLNEKVQTLEEEIKRMTRENQDVKRRLSQMASEQMRKNNPLVEELADSNRPTLIAGKWKELFSSGDYFTLYQIVERDVKTDDKTLEHLHTLLLMAYGECINFFNHITATVKECNENAWKWSYLITENSPVSSNDLFSRAVNDYLTTKITDNDLLRSAAADACTTYMKSVVKGEQSDLEKAVLKEMSKLDVSNMLFMKIYDKSTFMMENRKIYETFLLAVLRLYYAMRTNQFPMVAVFNPGPGDPYDPFLFECEDSQKHAEQGLVIKSVLYPPILRHENGAVLAKGSVTLRPS